MFWPDLAHLHPCITRLLLDKIETMYNRYLLLIILFAASLTSACVSQKKYKQLRSANKQLNTRYSDLDANAHKCQADLSACNSRVNSLQEQLASEQADSKALQSALDKCLTSFNQGNVNISKLLDEINSANKYIKQLVDAKHKSDSLNLVLVSNLTRSLERDEMQDIDVKVLKGVVYISLSENMLYKSGSYQISEKANAILNKIAKIITDYNDYDVLVEGNTDTVPIARPNIRNNWDLSVLRASSVVQALQNEHGVDPKRMTAGGRGEYNPIAENATDDGRYKNRRTQIIITPRLNQFVDLMESAPKTGSN